MKRKFEAHGYQVNLVDLKSAIQFLGEETMKELNHINNNKKFFRSKQTISDLIRFELLIKYGGVYFDMATFLQGEVDWILNIARMPSHLFVNRFGELPKVLTSFSLYLPNSPFWKVHEKYKIKESYLMDYYNYFLAAEKGSEYLINVQTMFKKML